MRKSKTRRITVYDMHHFKQHSETVIVPYIRLSGKWLQQLGFSTGQKVLIKTAKNKIIITPDETTAG